jgi:hypothetical protein
MLVDFDWLSYLWLVLPTAHAALDADEMARLQWRIAPETWHEERQQREADPALCATHLVGGAAAARTGMIDEIALRVAHAVVEHAACTHHARYRVDAVLDAVRRERTRTLSIPLLLIELLAVPKTQQQQSAQNKTLQQRSSFNSPTPQPRLYQRALLHNRLVHIERRALLQAARRVAPPEHGRERIVHIRIVVVVDGGELHVRVVVGRNYRGLSHWWREVLVAIVSVGIV